VKRVAIYGGSFNPIHNGHLSVAKSVVAQGLSDEVWLMVSPRNPLKPTADLLPEEERLAMARQATQGLSGIRVSDFEFHLKRPSYTWVTLLFLRQAYPTITFTLLIGSDNWTVFDRWAHHDELLTTYGLLVYPRLGHPIDEAQLPPQVHLVDAPLFPISSTEIRQAIQRGESAAAWLPQAVAQTIEAKHFYCQ